MAHPTVTPRGYLLVYAALLVFTVLTLQLSLVAHLGEWELHVALGIATVKTALVMLFFMHLWQSSRLIWLVVAAATLFVSILISFTLADYGTRYWAPQPSPGAVRGTGR